MPVRKDWNSPGVWPPPGRGRMAQLSRFIMTVLGSGTIIGSFLSYTQSGLVPLTMFGYGLALSGLVISMLITARFSRHLIQRVVPFTTAFLAATLASGLAVAGAQGLDLRLVQELFYPLGALLILLTGFHILRQSGPFLGWCILGLGFANLAVGIAGVAGVTSSAGPFGPVEQGRFVFGTTLRSSNGLMLNVNYFAVTQAALGFLYALYRHTRTARLSRNDFLLAGLLIASSVVGSSRGVTVSILAVAAMSLLALAVQRRGKSRQLFRFLLALAIAFVSLAFSLYWAEIQEIFRFERGLNLRDEIWVAVIFAWLERPLLGWSTEAGAALGFASGGEFAGRSAHSGFLHALLSGGVVGFALIYGFLLYCLALIVNRLPLDLDGALIPLACVGFFLMNSLFRTYSFGGVGLVPLLALLGLSVCLHKAYGSEVKSVRQRRWSGIATRV